MARPKLGTPFEIVLPSGARATVRAVIRREPGGELPRGLARAIELGAVESTLDLHAAPLCDANVVESVLAAIGAVHAPRTPFTCRNCGEAVELDAAAALPLGPLLNPPGDPELDPPADREEWHELPRAIEIARGRVDRFRLARRTLRDRLTLERLLGDDPRAPLPLGAPLIRALGLDALGNGEPASPVIKSPIAIARALETLDDETFAEVWDAIARGYDHQHWPPRLLSPVACPKCGARNDVEPLPRPLRRK